MVDFTRYQRHMWCWLTYLSVCRFYIDQDERGQYVIKQAGYFRLFIYYGLWCNSLIKLVYLVLTYRGYLVEVHFLDQMSMWDWFLAITELFQEANMWYRKYPLYEVLHANWKIQEEVFRKLGSPKHVQDRILKNDKGLVLLHLMIITVGCSSLVFQLRAAPKYALNTYAVVPYGSFTLEVIFAVHEIIFIFHLWAHQASSIVLCEVFASTHTHIIREMTVVLQKLIQKGRVIRKNVQEIPRSSTALFVTRRGHGTGRGKRVPDDSQRIRHADVSDLTQSEDVRRHLELGTRVEGTEYDIMTLLGDYRKMMMSTTAFNNWAGRLQGGTTGSNYGQFVSDVFMMIQLLKEPDTDFMAVFFFMEDACAGMIILFRMLIIISRLHPASEDFLLHLRRYLSQDVSQKKYLLKYQRTLRIIASKLGGYSTKGITVPKGINLLMSWYINAALWKRPKDRKT